MAGILWNPERGFSIEHVARAHLNYEYQDFCLGKVTLFLSKDIGALAPAVVKATSLLAVVVKDWEIRWPSNAAIIAPQQRALATRDFHFCTGTRMSAPPRIQNS